ncbi:MAG: FG-GAP-like repeat-containing protein [Patescibacteria group bacterium]
MKKIFWLALFAGFVAILSVPGTANAYPFNTTHDYAAGTQPQGIARADFNSDGKQDLAVVALGSNQVNILLGVGNGTFAVAVPYAVGNQPWAVATGDFDADGNLDLVVTNGSGNRASFLQGVGDGTFLAAVDYATGNSPRGIVTGDFDEDGDLDFAVANISAHTVSIFIGAGDGTFAAKADYAVVAGLYPVDLVAEDFDEDGSLDLAVANSCAGCFIPYSNGSVSILTGRGDGTFNAAVSYATTKGAVRMTSGDFNGDGDVDVAVVKRSTNELGILLGRGDGTLQAVTYSTVGATPQGLVSGDFNADGKLDVVTANGGDNTLSFLMGKGDGTFDAHTTTATGASPVVVAKGDFNRDGKLDLAVSDYTDNAVRIFMDTSSSTLASLDPSTAAAGTSPLEVTITGTGFAPDSIVRVDGNDHATTYISTTKLKATLNTGELGSAATRNFTVYVPSTVSTSDSLGFTVTAGSQSSGGGGSLPPEAYVPPIEPDDGFHVVINGGESRTPSRTVDLKFVYQVSKEPRTTRFAVSNEPDFKTAVITDIATVNPDKYPWDLCGLGGGAIVPADCPLGLHTVYVKFYSRWGRISDVHSASIEYGNEIKVESSETPAKNAASAEVFKVTLKPGTRSAEVMRLQKRLNASGFTIASSGPGSAGQETDFYGAATRSALKRFQEAHAAEILKPLGLSSGTGIFGLATMKFMNSL